MKKTEVTGNLYDYINPKGEGYINPTGEGKSKDHPNDAKDDGYLQPQSPKVIAEQWGYTKGDEKVVYKRVEPRGMDEIGEGLVYRKVPKVWDAKQLCCNLPTIRKGAKP